MDQELTKDYFIDYKDAPTGKAYIGVAKAPLMPNVKGHGFQGVLIQDEERELIECAACGKWSKKISYTHLKKCSGLKPLEYKEKFGLNKTRGLVSDALSFKLTQCALKNQNINNIGKYTHTKGTILKMKVKRTREMENEKGTCPEQIKARLYEFIRCNRELPSTRNRGRALYKILKKRFGSYPEGLAAHGLPFLKRKGTNMMYIFPDDTIYKYNLNRFPDREALYNMMLEKCPALSKK